MAGESGTLMASGIPSGVHTPRLEVFDEHQVSWERSDTYAAFVRDEHGRITYLEILRPAGLSTSPNSGSDGGLHLHFPSLELR